VDGSDGHDHISPDITVPRDHGRWTRLLFGAGVEWSGELGGVISTCYYLIHIDQLSSSVPLDIPDPVFPTRILRSQLADRRRRRDHWPY
jgi:hypothetical protein